MIKQHVKEIMNAFPILVEEDTSIIDVFKIFKRKKVSHLLVVAGTKLVGVLSKEDLLNKMVELSEMTTGRTYNAIILKTTPVKEIMSSELIVAHPNDLLLVAVAKMLAANVHCIPVLNDEKEPIGVLTPIDLLGAIEARKTETV
ncbi:MAG: CBS domain-containing protein [Saprospiraceae bacterium]|nr:CBS domain-containing protein [Saprospiraceae bacterium]